MKVGFIHDKLEIYPLPAGGKERFVINLAKALSRKQAITEVIILTLTVGFNKKQIKFSDKITIKRIDSSDAYKQIFHLLNSCDIVNINTCNFLFPIPNDFKAKTIYHLHDIFIGIRNEGRHLDKAIVNNWDAIVCPSAFAYDYAINFYHYLELKDRMFTIPRGVNLEVFNKNTPDLEINDLPSYLKLEFERIKISYPLIVFPHRIDSKKGEHFLLAIIKEMKILYENPAIIVTNPNISSRDEYKKLRRQYPNEIILLGWLEDKILCRLLKMSDLVLVLSLNPETFSQITVEALACGTKVVSTQFGNLRELASQFNNIVPTNPSVGDIINSIEKSISMERDKCDFIKIKDHYSYNVMADLYLRLFKSIKKVDRPKWINRNTKEPFFISSPFSYSDGRYVFVSENLRVQRFSLSEKEIYVYNLLRRSMNLNDVIKKTDISLKAATQLITKLIKLKIIQRI